MTTAYHNFGPCVPQVSTGVSSAFEVLGVCDGGSRVEETFATRNIHTDLSGPDQPAEKQMMGVAVRVTMDISDPDETVITKIKQRSMANGGGTAGTPGTTGALLATGGHAFSLYLPSSTADPWVITTCSVAQNGITEGTVAGTYRITFEGWRFIPGANTTVSGTKLYTRTAPP
jgi:hypothetical protein